MAKDSHVFARRKNALRNRSAERPHYPFSFRHPQKWFPGSIPDLRYLRCWKITSSGYTSPSFSLATFST
jgi:hypothetical protein